MNTKQLTIVIVFFLFTCTAWLQAQELGKPFIRNYSAKEYNAGSIMFDIAQDHRGVLLFANAWNIREYDGVTWNDTHLSNQRSAYCVEMSEEGIPYVGGDNEFGYLVPNEVGKLSYVSLRDQLDEEIKSKNLGRINDCFKTDVGMVFVSINHVILWDGKKLKTWAFNDAVNGAFFMKQLHINLYGKGLHRLENGEFKLVNGGEVFKNNAISAGLAFHDERLLIVTQSQGVFITNQSENNYHSFERFPTALDDYLKKHTVTSAIKMASGAFAIGTYTGGAAIVDVNFELMCFVDRSTGLQDNGVINLFEDKDQILWLALRNGTSRVEITTPINSWDESSGLDGYARTLKRFEGVLYVGTTKGIYYLVDHGKGHSEFFKVKGLTADVLSSHIYRPQAGNEQLLFMSRAGLYSVKMQGEEPKLTQLFPNFSNQGAILRAANQPANRLYATDGTQVRLYEYKGGKWVDEGAILGLEGMRHDILDVDQTGKIWTIAFGGKVTRFDVTYDGNGYWATKKESFGFEAGLPDDKFTGFAALKDDFLLTSEKGIYRFNEQEKKFQIASSYGEQLADYFTGFYFFEEDAKGNLWYYAYQMGDDIWHEVAYKQPDGTFTIDSVSLRRIPVTDTWLEGTYAEENGSVWFGGTWGLYRYDDSQSWSAPTTFNALIRKVTTGDDSLLFHGAFTTAGTEKVLVEQDLTKKIKIPYTANSLIFHFASNSFFDEAANEYSYKLEGSAYDTWSHWEKETKEHIQNLSEGNYVFRVRARNIYGIVSQEASYSFTILPPWYRTNFAYTLYALGAIFLVWLIVRLNTLRLRKQKQRLEVIVEKRTEKIKLQAETLKQANQEITAASEEILAKNEEITAANEEIVTKNEALAQQQEELIAKSEEIYKQNELLETTNRKITDSINYASRIQRAILGEEQLIEGNFKDAFLLFKPKDIVSGDFYWFTNCKTTDLKQRKKLLIAADCTGHGVPGAFMTVMGSSILNEIVNDHEVLAPNRILEALDAKVVAATNKQSLNGTTHKQNGRVNDGMDMQVLLIDSWNAKLYFSGAKNPLYRVRDGEIQMYKGSKFPIGSNQFRIKKEFELEEIDMLPGDKFYIASDGYQDQFGGPEGRKFLRKRFRSILLDTSHLPMAKQKQELEKAFLNWKGSCKQTDDILVIGFEV
ncbi:MAG: SpoIIE family protein phosphatase [Flammeovirgaceae bacterium]